MKNSIKLLSVFVLLFVFVFASSFRSEASNATAIKADFTLNESPRTLYVNNCARCHGADGKSQTETGKLYDTPDISGGQTRKMSTKRLTTLIAKGEGSMPGFAKKMTKAQISSLVSYVRGL